MRIPENIPEGGQWTLIIPAAPETLPVVHEALMQIRQLARRDGYTVWIWRIAVPGFLPELRYQCHTLPTLSQLGTSNTATPINQYTTLGALLALAERITKDAEGAYAALT